MSDFPFLVVEPLKAVHDGNGFRCGVESLDRYLEKRAGQDTRRRISRVFVAATREEPTKVVGYYSLSALSIELKQLPEKLARRLPKHPVPAALLGRLAVCGSARGKGVGKMLLADAVKRTISASEQIAVYALVVDAVDESAESFYRKFGFSRLGDESRRLFLPLKSI